MCGNLIDLVTYNYFLGQVMILFNQLQVITATNKAKDACKTLGKPSAANAKVLAGLFPTYAKSGVKR